MLTTSIMVGGCRVFYDTYQKAYDRFQCGVNILDQRLPRIKWSWVLDGKPDWGQIISDRLELDAQFAQERDWFLQLMRDMESVIDLWQELSCLSPYQLVANGDVDLNDTLDSLLREDPEAWTAATRLNGDEEREMEKIISSATCRRKALDFWLRDYLESLMLNDDAFLDSGVRTLRFELDKFQFHKMRRTIGGDTMSYWITADEARQASLEWLKKLCANQLADLQRLYDLVTKWREIFHQRLSGDEKAA